ncbi:MAG: polyhydroxyalkanoate synthesis repressor PhaR [Methylobacteriaceae bacterium]|nr:polyhydroxyalkanoate synthesis repressor PhaR [Methylobacteriaceae bacterium]
MNGKEPVTIKKYANRRLYNTGASSYVTLEDLAQMVKKGEDFLVFDAKTGEDITRSVLAQIIFEQETKVGQNLLPIAFLRQLIRFYGDSMQTLVPHYLSFSLERLTAEQQKFREQMTSAFGQSPFAGQGFGSLEEMTRNNMAMFQQAFAMFNPFAAMAGHGQSDAPDASEDAPPAKPSPQDLEALKKELSDMRKRLDKLSG